MMRVSDRKSTPSAAFPALAVLLLLAFLPSIGQAQSSSNSPPSELANISTRLQSAAGENALFGGFIITGNAQKRVLIRALAPSLGLAGTLVDPTLTLTNSSGFEVYNNNWREHEQTIRDTGIPPPNDLESAIVAELPPGSYTAIVDDVGTRTGLALVEIYDLGTVGNDPSANSKLAELSTRGWVRTGDNVMIGGFIITDKSTRVIIRAIGPTLTPHNIQTPLADPVLELHDGSGSLMFSNDDWRSDQEQAIIATGVPPADDRESALVATLSPGNYTAIVRGKNDSSGIALVEVYDLN
jgi:hypothetical protein